MKTTKKIDLKNFDQPGLVGFVESLGQPAFRGRQIMAWLYRPGIKKFSEMTDLAKSFRTLLSEHAFISQFEDPLTESSEDGSIKFAFSLEDGQIIESVLIPETDRNTLCISSQVGCAMECSFCRTGSMGFKRNLTAAEIVNQVCSIRDYLLERRKRQDGDNVSAESITNIVFMGMGEPLNNFNNLLTSLAILTDQRGLDMAGRRITVSTCGVIPRMPELGNNSSVNLAISLHAVDNESRDKLMPVNRRYPIEELMQACRDYPIQKRKRIMIEYIMLAGVNDSDEQAGKLANLLKGVPCKINLLPFNECDGIIYRASSRQRILAFQKILRDCHYSVFIRNSRGSDISAACGQLAGQLSGLENG